MQRAVKARKLPSPGQVVLWIVFFTLTLTMIVPLLNILARSLSSPTESIRMGGLAIFPRDFSLVNYRLVLSHQVLFRSLLNSVWITVMGTLINILLTTCAAYALTRPKLPGKGAMMAFLIVMMLFEPGLVPEYLLIKDVGLMGSQWSVILMGSVNVYYLVIMMRYFEEVPSSIIEAAHIDGAGHLRMLLHICLPLSKAGVATIAMFYAVLRWNEYFRASIYIMDRMKTTLQVILRQFVVLNDTVAIIGAQNLLNYNEIAKLDYGAVQSATIVVAILPILLLYPIVLKYYTKDIMGGGVKE